MPIASHKQFPNSRLPDSLRPFFWSYRFEELEPGRDEKTVVTQLINYGSLTEWRWLIRQYGTEEVKRLLQSLPATEIKPRTRVLASLLFSIPKWRYARRSVN